MREPLRDYVEQWRWERQHERYRIRKVRPKPLKRIGRGGGERQG